MTAMIDARAQYYKDNDFGDDGGASDKWVVFKLGPLPFVIPNSKARMRAVAYHDLHHILTGYKTDWRGEFEISAFEVGAGCHGFWVAWVLNLMGMLVGSVALPGRVWRAFVRGRSTSGLYGQPDLSPYLERDVESVRAELGLDQPAPQGSVADVPAFVGFMIGAAVVYTVAWVVLLAPVAALWWALS